ncbi:MAG: Ig-like domain-containing protein [bacterium]|nr:Ig-like domain-containing protein [bacterium]
MKVDPNAFMATASNPANGATGVALLTAVEVTFNANVDPGSVTEATFQLVRDGAPVAATRSSEGRHDPPGPQRAPRSVGNLRRERRGRPDVDRRCPPRLRLRGGLLDRERRAGHLFDGAGRRRGQCRRRRRHHRELQRHAGCLDREPVLVPAEGRQRSGCRRGIGRVGSRADLRPPHSAWLADDTSFTITLTEAIRDVAGRPLTGGRTFGFRTAPPMHLVSSTPANGATLVRIENVLTMVFEFPVDPATVNSGSVSVTADTWVNNQYQPVIPGTLSVSDRTVTFTPTGGAWQEYETGYRVSLTGTIRGSGNQRLDGNPTFSFRTVFFDEAFAYRIFVEGLDGGRHLQVYSNYWSLMHASITESSYWQFVRLGDWGWAIRNLLSETAGKYFDAMDGVQSMRLVDVPPGGGVYTGQTWTPARYNNRGGRQGPQESPGNYYLSSQTFGTDEVLTAKFVDARQQWECFLESRQALVHQLWYFRRDYRFRPGPLTEVRWPGNRTCRPLHPDGCGSRGRIWV